VQGIAAITANNGWAMAVAGICIVMSGLAILAVFISQLHKFVALLEGKDKYHAAFQPEFKSPHADQPTAAVELLNDLPAAAAFCRSLTMGIGESFPLIALYRIFQKENLPHPHITITALRYAGFLAPVGDGQFSWKNI